MTSIFSPTLAGGCKGLEQWKGLERDWNAIETKCIGLGDPYCEFKLVPREIDELRGSLEKDSAVIKRIHDRLMQHLMGFLIDGNPLAKRPRLGSDFIMAHPEITLPAVAGERYRMAMRMGGAKAGKEVGKHLMNTEIGEDEAIKRILNFLKHCKVGKITSDKTIRIKESSESLYTKAFAMRKIPI